MEKEKKNNEEIRDSNTKGNYETFYFCLGMHWILFESNRGKIKMINRMKSYTWNFSSRDLYVIYNNPFQIWLLKKNPPTLKALLINICCTNIPSKFSQKNKIMNTISIYNHKNWNYRSLFHCIFRCIDDKCTHYFFLQNLHF